ncbi:hypothetical protein F5878DRAFT_694682 [Lentinula raphanica]|uniref:Uncharacterized protein n=1 Tax=Lentinula raphanica TaxID=153919 RepID=A0AA38PHG0_9AGAR|nr:hypothetical protein F5878DRAFT_694682 [Lentinula raphanica]
MLVTFVRALRGSQDVNDVISNAIPRSTTSQPKYTNTSPPSLTTFPLSNLAASHAKPGSDQAGKLSSSTVPSLSTVGISTLFSSSLRLITLNNLNEDLTIIPFIRHLYIEQGGSNRFPPIRAYVEWGADDDHEHDQPSVIDSGSDYEIFQFDDFLHRLVGLTAVRSLKLGWVRCDTTELTSGALRGNFAGVTSLNLDSVILSSPMHFFDILNAFPLLSSLSLTGVLFNGGRLYDGLDNWEKLDARRTNLETTPAPPPHLRTLQLDATEDVTEFLFSWMAYHDTPLPMQSLECGLFSSSSNAALSKFLACSGSSIEDLLFPDAHEPTQLDLSPCVNLQRLNITYISLQSSNPNCDGDAEDPREPGSITFLTDLLHTISSHRMKRIKISLALSEFEDGYDQIYAFDWRGLMLSLGQDQFSGLESVVIPFLSHRCTRFSLEFRE